MKISRSLCLLLSYVMFFTQSFAYAAPYGCREVSAAAAKDAKIQLQKYQEELDKKSLELKDLKASGKRMVKIGSKYTTGIAASSSALFTVLSVNLMGASGTGAGAIATGLLAVGAATVAAVTALIAVVAGTIWFFTRNNGNEVPIEEFEKQISDLKTKTIEARKALDQTNSMNVVCNKYQDQDHAPKTAPSKPGNSVNGVR